MLTRFSARPAGSSAGSQRLVPASSVIERFFALLERLAPERLSGLPEPLETKDVAKPNRRRMPRVDRAGPVGSATPAKTASTRSRKPKVQP
jgi:hypothetical protein